MGKIPGIVKPLAKYQGWQKSGERRTTAEKREVIVRGIQRYRNGERRASRLEFYDAAQGGPVIRVLYSNHPMPIFDGHTHALIDPKCDRNVLWDSIVEQIRAGAYDREIEAVSKKMHALLEENRVKKANAQKVVQAKQKTP